MRILLFTSSYAPRHGGLETVTRRLASEFRDAGHEIVVVTNRYPFHLHARDVVDGIPVYRQLYPNILPGSGGTELRYRLQRLALAPFAPIALARLVRLMWRWESEVVNVHYFSYPAIYAIVAARILRLPIVLSFHGSDVPVGSFTARYRWPLRAITLWVDAFTACSQHLASRLRDVLPPDECDRVAVIYNAVDLTPVHAPAHRWTSPSYLFLPARLVDKKGIDVAIRAMTILRDSRHVVPLLIAGDGPQRARYEGLARSLGLEHLVSFLGEVSHDRVQALMKDAFLVLAPSVWEAFGMAPLEAMAAGKAVVASRVGGIPEVVVDGETGLLVEPDDPGALAAAIGHLLDDPEEAARLGERGRARAGSSFTWDRARANYLRVYETARNRRNRTCIILAYHEIAPIGPDMRHSLVVSPETFARHLRALRAAGARFVSLDSVAAALRGGLPLPRRAVVLTFDDGYAGIHRYALPVLDRFACPATVFVPSALVGQRGEADQPPIDKMGSAELRRLIRAGHAIGAHTRTHPDLRVLSDAELRCEVEGSKRDLEALLQQEITTFCYPYGHVDERVRTAVRNAGYHAACTTVPGHVEAEADPYALPRLVVGNDLPAPRLLYRLWRVRWMSGT